VLRCDIFHKHQLTLAQAHNLGIVMGDLFEWIVFSAISEKDKILLGLTKPNAAHQVQCFNGHD
jgi:hypothetical protein